MKSEKLKTKSEQIKAKKILTTENEAMDGESLARNEVESPKGCEQDANYKRLKKNKKREEKPSPQNTLNTQKRK